MSLPSRSKKRMLTQSVVIDPVDSANCSKIFETRYMRTPSVTFEAMLTPFAATQHVLGDQLESRRSSACPLGTCAISQPHATRLLWYAVIAFLVYHLTNLGHAGDLSMLLVDFTPDWQGQGSVWDAYRRTCPSGSPARQLYSSYRNPNIQKQNVPLGNSQGSDDPFAFVKTVDDDYDFCENPWARFTQGHFFSDWRIVPGLSPVLSPSKAKGFADIRIPSHYYQGGNAQYSYAYDPVTRGVKEIDDMEVPWDQKSDLIFWRGATTGGGSSPPGFTPTYQRHRYLSFPNQIIGLSTFRSDSSV